VEKMSYQLSGKTVYHGGITCVMAGDLAKSKLGCDFGVAFYVTTSKAQAEVWARSKKKRTEAPNSVVSQYIMQDTSRLNINKFDRADIRWLDYIKENRTNSSRRNLYNFDLVIGPVADDDTQIVIENYIDGAYRHFGHLEKVKVIEMLEPRKLKNQIALCTPKAIAAIKYVSHYSL
jgi:hypothetical protein